MKGCLRLKKGTKTWDIKKQSEYLTKMCNCNPYIVCIEDKEGKSTHYVRIAVTHSCQNTKTVL